MTARADFNPLAEDYARYRVGYGDEVFAAIAGSINPVFPLGVLDLASGSGISTLPLGSMAGGKTEEFLARYAELLRELRPGEQAFEERNIVSLFSGRNR